MSEHPTGAATDGATAAGSVEELTHRAAVDLARVLGGGRTVALVNSPDHGNPGDPGLWLGTRALLRRLGVRVGYSASWWCFDPAALRAAVPHGPVLLNGGGNLGDLYAGQQGTRERVLRTLTDRRVIQLPQSWFFRSERAAREMSELIAGHGAVTVMVRDRASALRADDAGVSTVLSPDHAVGLATLHSGVRPVHDVLWMVRRPGDPEYGGHADPPERAGWHRRDWMDGIAQDQSRWTGIPRAAVTADGWLRTHWRPAAPGLRHLWPAAAATFPHTARAWVQRGVDLLASARVVVTDRLHGHLFCVLLGKPHVVLDNSYGKVSAMLDSWTGTLPGVHRAGDTGRAVELAGELLGRIGAP
jgi:pyruvyl transferase EpsO